MGQVEDQQHMYKIALIGYGYWGQKAIKYLPRLFDVKWTCTSKTDLAQVWPDVEAVMIATPIDTHFDLALQAIHKGKHVFVEKPLAMNTANAELLKAEAERMGVKLAVDYTQTFSKGIQKAVKLVKESGGPRFIEMSTKNLGRFKPYSVYWLLASHWLSVLDMVVPLKNFSASGFEQKPVETASILLSQFGCKARIDVSLNCPEKEMRAIFYCKDATVVYDAQIPYSVRLTNYDRSKDFPQTTTGECFSFDEKNNLAHSVQYFHDLIEGKAESNVDRAIAVTSIIEQIEKGNPCVPS